MARDPVKISATLDDNSLTNEFFVGITDGTEQLLVNADGSLTATIQDGGNSITVDAVDLDIRALSESTDQVLVFANTAADGTGTDLVPLVDASGHLQVDILSGGGGNASVAVDDSAFTVATDSVTVIGAFADETATDSVDEGDLGAVRMSLSRQLITRVDNASGAAAVNIQDGGNTISVDDAAGSLTVDNATLSVVGGGVEATALRVTIANDSTGLLSVDDNGGSLTVDAVDLDIRDLSASQDNVAISDGTDTLAVNTDGSINVVTQSTSGTPQINTLETAALGAGSSDNHTVTASGGTLEPGEISVSSESIATFEILAGASGGPTSYGVVRTSVENPNATFTFPDGFTVADTQIIRVTRTNDSNKVHTVNSTIRSFQN
jgi:hypothetical protein